MQPADTRLPCETRISFDMDNTALFVRPALRSPRTIQSFAVATPCRTGTRITETRFTF